MGMFDKFNAGGKSVIMDGVVTDGMEFAKLSAFRNQTVKVRGFFFNKSKRYNKEQVVVVGENYLINMPDRATDQFLGIMADEEAKAGVLAGKLALKIGDEVKTDNGTTTHYDLVEV